MKYHKVSGGFPRYRLHLVSLDDARIAASWEFNADLSGLAAVLRSVDLATNDAQVARAIGLRKKRIKHLDGGA